MTQPLRFQWEGSGEGQSISLQVSCCIPSPLTSSKQLWFCLSRVGSTEWMGKLRPGL